MGSPPSLKSTAQHHGSSPSAQHHYSGPQLAERLLWVVLAQLPLEIKAPGRTAEAAGIGALTGQIGPVAAVQGRVGIDQHPLKKAGAPGPGQPQFVHEVGGHPLAALVGKVAGGQ